MVCEYRSRRKAAPTPMKPPILRLALILSLVLGALSACHKKSDGSTSFKPPFTGTNKADKDPKKKKKKKDPEKKAKKAEKKAAATPEPAKPAEEPSK
jgi:hypothetical protein